MDSDGLYSCPGEACAHRAGEWQLLYRHVVTKHDDFIIDKNLGADATVAVFQRPNSELQCPKCAFRSESHASVKQHISINHAGLGVASDLVQIEDRPAPFRCPDCSYASTEWPTLQKHCASRHKRALPDEPSYALPAFDRTVGTPVYDCPKERCLFETTDLLALQEHLKVAHSGKKRKAPDPLPRYLVPPKGPYACPACSVSITNWPTLLAHVTREHLDAFAVDRPTTCKGRELQCPVAHCGYQCKTTALIDGLASHCESAHGYSCARASGVATVVPARRGRKPVYVCPLCSFETGLAASLRYHSEDVHGRKVAIKHAPKQPEGNDAAVNAEMTDEGDFRIVAPVPAGAEIIFQVSSR
ncbi:hypothetical protein SPRG_16715 [Saprolegnia parasitica CBS 223.65]|uniref:C2H2-type domain-containing protein n=1 Tax=Saprolegnia parasitica (strain CBS 223.65) TaxID=695850 RepID=A0A067BHJ9_SAPPC|nr:hypothetical protein SPRG_16715 [Saprolegnia parasitica CBS 223.65]KDO17869.1 hypothetical protein SPRG_16715 [Saprolegnia parasitica CBS 223.65]|eukprot:XP_012211420.1 hypothetical protein SPRG_16715 [Saprolegnia parasitica CBS 223.65]